MFIKILYLIYLLSQGCILYYLVQDIEYIYSRVKSFTAINVYFILLAAVFTACLFVIIGIIKVFCMSEINIFSSSKDPLFIFANAYLLVFWIGGGGSYLYLLRRAYLRSPPL